MFDGRIIEVVGDTSQHSFAFITNNYFHWSIYVVALRSVKKIANSNIKPKSTTTQFCAHILDTPILMSVDHWPLHLLHWLRYSIVF